jgi:uncharacterized hydrophobic protein (TIGR00271 family)
MLHLRVITPTDRTDEVTALLEGDPGVTNVVVIPGVARQPSGDLVLCDVAREGANEVLDELDRLGLRTDGSVAAERVDLSMSSGAKAAEAAAAGHEEDAVIWAELDERTSDSARLTWAFVVFLTLATQIAAIGRLLDSQILIVGAMVLGPEFGPVSAICFGFIRRDPPRIARAIWTLVAGFALAIAITFTCAIVSRWLGWIEPSMLDRGEMTDFIVKPDRWSFVIAVLAGVAGVLSITAGKSSALVGVFISVTTVPAAGNIAAGLALSHLVQVRESLVQLGVNLLGMMIAGTATLLVQRLAWRALPPRLRPRPAVPPLNRPRPLRTRPQGTRSQRTRSQRSRP